MHRKDDERSPKMQALPVLDIETARELWDLPAGQRTRRLCELFAIRPRKSLGQHFLINDGAAERIADLACEGNPPGVVEIGGGLGALTIPLIRRCERVVVYEIDPLLCAALGSLCAPAARKCLVVCGDVLEVDFAEAGVENGWNVAGNLPYHITTPVLERIFLQPPRWRRAVFMVQREFAQRLAAQPGSKAYGSLTVFAQVYCKKIERVMELKPGSFWPPPQVASTVVVLELRSAPPKRLGDPTILEQVVTAAFQHRRKSLLRALATSQPLGADEAAVRAALEEAGIDGRRRAETLTVDEFGALAKALARIVAEGSA